MSINNNKCDVSRYVMILVFKMATKENITNYISKIVSDCINKYEFDLDVSNKGDTNINYAGEKTLFTAVKERGYCVQFYITGKNNGVNIQKIKNNLKLNKNLLVTPFIARVNHNNFYFEGLRQLKPQNYFMKSNKKHLDEEPKKNTENKNNPEENNEKQEIKNAENH